MYNQAEQAQEQHLQDEEMSQAHRHGHNAPAAYDFNAARERMNRARREEQDMQADELAAVFFAEAAGKDDYFVTCEWPRLRQEQRAAATLDIHQMQRVEHEKQGRRVVVNVTMQGGRVESFPRMYYQDFIESRIERDGRIWYDGQGGIIHGERPAVERLTQEEAREWAETTRERMNHGRRAHSPISGRFKSQR